MSLSWLVNSLVSVLQTRSNRGTKAPDNKCKILQIVDEAECNNNNFFWLLQFQKNSISSTSNIRFCCNVVLLSVKFPLISDFLFAPLLFCVMCHVWWVMCHVTQSCYCYCHTSVSELSHHAWCWGINGWYDLTIVPLYMVRNQQDGYLYLNLSLKLYKCLIFSLSFTKS